MKCDAYIPIGGQHSINRLDSAKIRLSLRRNKT